MTQLIKDRKAKKDGRIVINVSFTEHEYDLINHVDKKGNFSQYIKRLILNDMTGQGQSLNNTDLMTMLLQSLQGSQQILNDQAIKKEEVKANGQKVKGIMSSLKMK